MAYTAGQLNEACNLFPGLIEQAEREFAACPLPASYDLRNRAAQRTSDLASWYDDDEDETYEPTNESSEKRKRPSPNHAAAPVPPRKVRMIDGSKYLNLKIIHDATHKPPSPGSSSEDEPDTFDQYWNVDPNMVSPNSRYLLRQREKSDALGSPQQEAEIATDQEQGVASPSDASTAPQMEPVRECKACIEIDMVCSLATDPDLFAYPCKTCADDEIECVVIPEPEWKRPCESCKDLHGETCSYRFADYDHSLPCLPCSNHGFKCVAGPAKRRPFIRLSDDATSSEQSSSPYSQDTTYQADAEDDSLDDTPEAQGLHDEGASLGSLKSKEREVIVISGSESESGDDTKKSYVPMKARSTEIIEISDDESEDEVPEENVDDEFDETDYNLGQQFDEEFDEESEYEYDHFSEEEADDYIPY